MDMFGRAIILPTIQCLSSWTGIWEKNLESQNMRCVPEGCMSLLPYSLLARTQLWGHIYLVSLYAHKEEEMGWGNPFDSRSERDRDKGLILAV